MNVGKVIVRTSDFRLAYRLLAGLKARHVRCAHLEQDAPLPPSALVWLATPEEVEAAADPLGIGATLESVDSSIERALRFVAKGGVIKELTFGIDPGPRPGLAWVGDGRILGTAQFESVDATSIESVPYPMTLVIHRLRFELETVLEQFRIVWPMFVWHVVSRSSVSMSVELPEAYSEISTMHLRTNRSNERRTCHTKNFRSTLHREK